MIWMSSDFHLSHARIIEYDNRPFSDLNEMASTIFNNVNQVVRENDIFYYLGDLAMGGPKYEDIVNYRKRIVCKNIHFILGNHDSLISKEQNKERLLGDGIFLSIEKRMEIYVKELNKKFVLDHYPLLSWNRMEYGSYMTHGHCHHNLKDNPGAFRIDVGINKTYFPFSVEDIDKEMKKKVFVPIDHHNRNTN